MMPDPWYKSKRVYAAAILMLTTAASFFGVTVGEETQGIIVDNLLMISTAVATLLTVWSKLAEKYKASRNDES